MIIYRPHRGNIVESMAKAKEFETKEEMKQYICEQNEEYYKNLGYDDVPYDFSDIVIDEESAHDDERTGWKDTMYVCTKRYFDVDYIKIYGKEQCIGMCARDYDKSAFKSWLNSI